MKVLEVHPEQQRISLSIKALQEAPKPEKEEVEEVVEETYELPEEDVSFSLADRLGDNFLNLKLKNNIQIKVKWK